MKDMECYQSFSKIEPIHKGWSTDRKYSVETVDGKQYLLRIADVSQYDRKKVEFKMMKQVAALGIPMSQPLEFGTCNNGKSVYSFFTWCEGEEATVVLPRLSKTVQYELGIASGKILKLIHSIPAPKEQEEWERRFNRKIRNRVEKYKACGIKIDHDDKLIEYIEHHRPLLSGRPQYYQHGDYHVGNMIISPDHTLSIIDFNRYDFGDPWEEFNRIVWSASVSPHFATGQINGYFDGKPPVEFFQLLELYISVNALSSIPWAIPFGEKEILTMKNQAKEVLASFNQIADPVPSWYLGKFSN